MAAPDAHQLDPTLVDEIVDRLGDVIVDRLVEAMRIGGLIPEATTAEPWLDAKDVAKLLGVERDWVYEHADELGATRIGSGPRPRLRFPPKILDRQDGRQPSAEAGRHHTKQPNKPRGLIPIHTS
jgi:predicted DNA-binding transcriptional regulator AlpA